MIEVNDAPYKEPDAGKPHVRISVRDVPCKGHIYSTPREKPQQAPADSKVPFGKLVTAYSVPGNTLRDAQKR